jgi:hypothetical protein
MPLAHVNPPDTSSVLGRPGSARPTDPAQVKQVDLPDRGSHHGPDAGSHSRQRAPVSIDISTPLRACITSDMDRSSRKCRDVLIAVRSPAPANPTLPAPTHRFHLLSMSTFKPHPLASTPTLDFPPFTQDIMQTRQLLQVMGDTLVVLVSRFASHWILAGMGIAMAGMAAAGNEEELVAWNWKTGAVLGVSRFVAFCRVEWD